MDCTLQQEVDQKMIDIDGTSNKSTLGANATLGVSLAVARAAANCQKIPLYQHLSNIFTSSAEPRMPALMVNIINGGMHADNNLDVQEFMLHIPSMPSATQGVQRAAKIFHLLRNNLRADGYQTNVGDEGGFAPALGNQVPSQLQRAIAYSGYTDITIALDVAASCLYRGGKYHLDGQAWSYRELVKFYQELGSEYPITSIEDGMSEDDYVGWEFLTARMGGSMQLVGGLVCTNKSLLQRGIEGNWLMLLTAQSDWYSESLATVRLKSAGYEV